MKGVWSRESVNGSPCRLPERSKPRRGTVAEVPKWVLLSPSPSKTLTIQTDSRLTVIQYIFSGTHVCREEACILLELSRASCTAMAEKPWGFLRALAIGTPLSSWEDLSTTWP
jgi:hypothetical protein